MRAGGHLIEDSVRSTPGNESARVMAQQHVSRRASVARKFDAQFAAAAALARISAALALGEDDGRTVPGAGR